MTTICPICNHNNQKIKTAFPYETYFNNRRFRYARCIKCNSTYMVNILNKRDLKKMYEKNKYHKVYYNNNSKISINPRLKKIINNLDTKEINFCDFGCGNGNLLNFLSLNYNKFGVEFSPQLVKELNLRFKNINFFETNDFFKSNKFKNFFDIIYIGDVLEHLQEPFSIIKKLSIFLKKNGFFIIEGPVEENYNIIYYVSKYVGNIKFFMNIKNNFIPYHTIRTNHDSQKFFFNRFNDLQIYTYETFETGWPYKKNGIIRNLISNVNSIIFKNENHKTNNRFISIIKKNK